MSNKTIIAIIIVILVIVGFIIWKSPFSGPSDTDTATTTEGDVLGEDTSVITADHFFDAATNTHTLEGVITLPTPCHTLTNTVATDGPADTDITIAFTTAQGGEICTQVLSQKIFHIEFKAAENATIHATLNGQPRELKLTTQGSAIQKL